MPRQRSGARAPARSAPARPTIAPARPNAAPPPQSTRSSSTAAAPSATAQQQQASQGSSLFGQMASTAAGVAVGSTIGHALGGFFGGSSSQAAGPSDAVNDTGATKVNDESYQTNSYGKSCEMDAKNFTKCLDDNKGNDYQMSICGWYLEQLKACQSAASQY